MTLATNFAVSFSCNGANFSTIARVPNSLFMYFLNSRNRGPYWVRAKDLFHPIISPHIGTTGRSEYVADLLSSRSKAALDELRIIICWPKTFRYKSSPTCNSVSTHPHQHAVRATVEERITHHTVYPTRRISPKRGWEACQGGFL